MRGLILDAVVFAANLTVVAWLTDWVRRNGAFGAFFGYLLVAGCVSHALGAHLKRASMHDRLSRKPSTPMPGWGILLFLTLFVMHPAVFIACSSMAIEAFDMKGYLGWREPAIVFAFGLLPTVMALKAFVPPRHPPSISGPELRIREAAADVCLGFSIIVVMALWDGFFVEYLSSAKTGKGIVLRLVLVVLTTVPFAMFYLAPRIVYLREDYRSRNTWLRAFLVMLPLAKRLVFG